jgi:tRNA(His) guanylyltransferase
MTINFDNVTSYEEKETARRTTKGNPVIVRLDGKNFSKWTSNLTRPYDSRLSNLMIEMARFLAKETNAIVSFTQSDELTLILHEDSPESSIYFDGRIQKLTSILAAHASVFFNAKLPEFIPEKAGSNVVFDCRVFEVDSKETAIDALMSRHLDGVRNSINNAGRTYFSHTSMMGQNIETVLKRLREIDKPWEDLPNFYKYGTYIVKKVISRKFTADELAVLPAKHSAHTNPDLMVERTMFYTNHELGKWKTLAEVADKETEIFG